MKRFGKYGELYVSPSTGLLALTENRYKIFIFGKTTIACVYRLADLYGYDYESEQVKNSEGKMETKHFCVLTFRNTNDPTPFVRMEMKNEIVIVKKKDLIEQIKLLKFVFLFVQD